MKFVEIYATLRANEGRMPKHKIDTKWFIQALKSRQLSQRGLARIMRLDVWSVWHMLRGSRQMQTTEAKQIADILGLPLTDVLRRAGVEVGDRRVPVTGIVRGNGTVTLIPNKPIDHVAGPVDLPHDAIALLCRTARGPLELADGCVLFTRSTTRVDDGVTGRLCLVQPADSKEPLLRFVRPGAKPPGYRLVLIDEETVTPLAWGSPILWVRT